MLDKVVKLKEFANSKKMRFFDWACAALIAIYAGYQFYIGDNDSGWMNLGIAGVVALLAYLQPAIMLEKTLKKRFTKTGGA